MAPTRFRIRTIMIVIAVSGLLMGSYRSSPTIFNGLLGVVAHLLGVVALFVLLLVSSVVLIPLVAVYDFCSKISLPQNRRSHEPRLACGIGTEGDQANEEQRVDVTRLGRPSTSRMWAVIINRANRRRPSALSSPP